MKAKEPEAVNITTGEVKGRDTSLNIYQRILLVQSRVPWVEKKGRFDGGGVKYEYAKESDFLHVLRPLLAEAGIAVTFNLDGVPEETAITSKGGSAGIFARVFLIMELVNVDKPDEKVVSRFRGDAADYGDKAIYKSYTGAKKYLLSLAFLVSTGDDPEDDKVEQHHNFNLDPKRNPVPNPPRPVPPAEKPIPISTPVRSKLDIEIKTILTCPVEEFQSLLAKWNAVPEEMKAEYPEQARRKGDAFAKRQADLAEDPDFQDILDAPNVPHEEETTQAPVKEQAPPSADEFKEWIASATTEAEHEKNISYYMGHQNLWGDERREIAKLMNGRGAVLRSGNGQ